MNSTNGRLARSICIDGIEIGDSTDCYVIAEIGHNHQGVLEQAFQLFAEAQRAGASAVKLQKRHNRSLYTASLYDKAYDNENSFGRTYGEHREALEFDAHEYRELKAYAEELDITFFSTAFDFHSVEFLENLDMPAYKIASGDLRNTPLLRFIAETQKPIIFSTGGGRLDDVRRAYETIAEINPHVAMLQCTAGYPAEWGELDLRVIETYRSHFPHAVVGFSGHDNGIAMAIAAFVLGARIVEKHFTLNRAMRGTDHRFSLEPQGLRKLVRDLQRTRLALGDGEKTLHVSEIEPITKMSKKIVAASDLAAGHIVRLGDIALKSPGDGLPPYELENVLGRRLVQAISIDDAIKLEHLEPLTAAATIAEGVAFAAASGG
jgi:sialic acid synthase